MRADAPSFTLVLDPFLGVVVADGYGIKLHVRNRRLVIEDGLGDELAAQARQSRPIIEEPTVFKTVAFVRSAILPA